MARNAYARWQLHLIYGKFLENVYLLGIMVKFDVRPYGSSSVDVMADSGFNSELWHVECSSKIQYNFQTLRGLTSRFYKVKE